MENDRRRRAERIENQNEKDFIERAGDLCLFIHKVAKEEQNALPSPQQPPGSCSLSAV